MATSGVKFICDKAALLIKLKRAWDASLFPLSYQVLSDCNEYVKVDQNVLRGSSYIASDLKKGRLVWNTPYARRQYYTGTPNKEKNPNASVLWCEKAYHAYRKDWALLAQKLFNQEL